MFDCYNREINYLRISVTDRCNLRCVYCMPPEGIKLLSHKDILTYDEIVDIVKYAVSIGITKIRLTGGEPLVRKGIVNLVEMIAKVKGIKDFAMTTNAILLDKYAKPLADAGLNRVNISLDAIDPSEYQRITRSGDVNKVFEGIDAAIQAGLTPVKFNCVIKKSRDEKNARDVAEYAKEKGLELRYIHQMDLEHGEFSVVEGGRGGDCKRCNRIRLTSNGNVMPCLFSDIAYNVRELGIEEAFTQAIKNKPKSGTTSLENQFYNVGG